jgi:hypothetical protein
MEDDRGWWQYSFMSNTNFPITEATRSTSISHFGYNSDLRQLLVTFRRDETAEIVSGIYHEVPMDLHQELVAANANGGSVGRVFNAKVKNAGFRYERVGA